MSLDVKIDSLQFYKAMKNIKLAIVGAHGLPAKYGGYCTLAEYLAEYKPNDFDVTVYCVAEEYKDHPCMYKGVHLEWVNYPARGMMAWQFHAYGIKHAIENGADCIFLCGPNGGFILPFYRKYKDRFYLNIGGIEWKRNKYNWLMRRIVRLLMKCAVHNSCHLVADNVGMYDYYIEEYGRDDSVVIAYGGDQAQTSDITPEIAEKYPFLNKKFALAMARIQSDNNTEMLLKTFENARMPLVYIGNWDVTDWSRGLREKYSKNSNLILLDAIFDIPVLNQIRSNCSLYFHGHSAGGTNPSLVEAMHLGVPLLCYDNGFNNHTTFHKAFYFKTKEDIINIIENTSDEALAREGKLMRELAIEHYRWETIAKQYYDLFRKGRKDVYNGVNLAEQDR